MWRYGKEEKRKEREEKGRSEGRRGKRRTEKGRIIDEESAWRKVKE